MPRPGRETGLILRCAGKAGNPFQTTQGRLSGTGTAQESLPSRVFPPALSQHSQQRLALSLVSVALILRVVSVCASLVAGEWLTPAVCPQGIFFLRHLFSLLLLLFSPSVSPALRDPVDCSPPSSLSFTARIAQLTRHLPPADGL